MYNYNKITEYLETKYIGQTFVQYEEVNSTNNKAKHISKNCPEGMVVLAESQTDGKGRLGRTWFSPKEKNIYMSLILKPDSEPENVVKLTHIAAASVSKALEDLCIENKIKWPNDILVNGKKICGILCEMTLKKKEINSIVVGIGINVNMEESDIESDIKDKIISIKMYSNKKIEREKIIAYIFNNFEKYYNELKENNTINNTLDICKKNSAIINKYVEINKIGKKTIRKVKVLDITENGELLIENEKGENEIIISGEVSVRGEGIY